MSKISFLRHRRKRFVRVFAWNVRMTAVWVGSNVPSKTTIGVLNYDSYLSFGVKKRQQKGAIHIGMRNRDN